jgi:sugar phosphate isomerase/epimerase
LTWDVGHDAAAGGGETAFFLTHEARIGHMHLHDCVESDSHRPLFTGDVDIAGHVTRARRLGIRAVIETKTVAALEGSVRELKARGIFEAPARREA